MKALGLLLLGLFIGFNSYSQHAGNHVHGRVLNAKGVGLFSARISAPEVSKSVYADTAGNFLSCQ